MRWRDLRRSNNVEDARGANASSGGSTGGMRAGLPIGGKAGGIGFIVILAVVFFVGGPDAVLNMLSGSGGMTQAPGSSAIDPAQVSNEPAGAVPADDEGGQFVRAMLASTEDVWTQLLAEQGKRYAAPKLLLFTGGVQSACGFNSSAVGPFYCPPDQKVYVDLGFYDQLAQMGGAGDFAQAYVIGHEVGHHIQNLLGTSEQVQQMCAAWMKQAAISWVCGWSCKRTATRVCGRITPTRHTRCSSPAMSRKAWPPRRRLAMTPCNATPAARFRRTRSRTAQVRSAWSGCGVDCRRAVFRRAIRLRGAE